MRRAFRIALGRPRIDDEVESEIAFHLEMRAAELMERGAGGALGVMAVVRAIGDLLYGVRPFDPLTLGAAVATLVACAVVALLVPVRRATRVDPITTLR